MMLKLRKVPLAVYKEHTAGLNVADDGEVVLTDEISSIESGKTVTWTIGEGATESKLKGISLAAGKHNVNVYTTLSEDADLTNDTISLEVYAYDKPVMPFADSFENADDNNRWVAENKSDNALNWTIGSAMSNNVNWAKGNGENVAYMSSVAGAEHNAVLHSPVISIKNAGKVRLSYYYTTRMKASEADEKTYLEADRGYGLCQGICSRWQKDLSDRLQLLIEDGNH